jgi:quercetin dioxygenase-like cupin family protein
MRVIGSMTPTTTYGGCFVGEVKLSMLAPSTEDRLPDIALVAFEDGAVTCWHTHPGGQYIWVVSGLAAVGTDVDDEQTLSPGTLVEAPAGEAHWHGAAAGHDATLLTITWGTTAWSEKSPR